jgi:hypothetical protein
VAITERGLLPGLEAPWVDERRRELEELELEALDLVAEIGLGLGGPSWRRPTVPPRRWSRRCRFARADTGC